MFVTIVLSICCVSWMASKNGFDSSCIVFFKHSNCDSSMKFARLNWAGNGQRVDMATATKDWMTKKAKWTTKMPFLIWRNAFQNEERSRCVPYKRETMYADDERLFSHSAHKKHSKFCGIIFSVFWQLNHILTIFGIFFVLFVVLTSCLCVFFIWLNCISSKRMKHRKKTRTRQIKEVEKTTQKQIKAAHSDCGQSTLYLPHRRGWNEQTVKWTEERRTKKR